MGDSLEFIADKVRGKYVFNYSPNQKIVSVIVYISSLKRLNNDTWEKIQGIKPADGTLEIRVQTQKKYSTPEAEEIAKAAAVTRIMRYLERQRTPSQTLEISEKHVVDFVDETDIPWSYKPDNQSKTSQSHQTQQGYSRLDLRNEGSATISHDTFLKIVRGQPVGSKKPKQGKGLADIIRDWNRYREKKK
jgi:hypothetical protein